MLKYYNIQKYSKLQVFLYKKDDEMNYVSFFLKVIRAQKSSDIPWVLTRGRYQMPVRIRNNVIIITLRQVFVN